MKKFRLPWQNPQNSWSSTTLTPSSLGHRPSTSTTSTREGPQCFPQFSRLPPEIRHRIWILSLPPPIGPTLHPYRPGLWQPRYLQPSDPDYSPTDYTLNLTLNFRHDLLPASQVPYPPLLQVSPEARVVTMCWLAMQGFTAQHESGRRAPVFARAFDPERDVLYVPREGWENFLHGAGKRGFAGDMMGRMHSIHSYVRRVAVPEQVLRGDCRCFDELWETWTWVRDLYVVKGLVPGFEAEGEGAVRTLGVRELRGGCWAYDRDGGKFKLKGAERVEVEHEGVYRMVGEILHAGLETYPRECLMALAVRPVRVVKRGA